MHVRKSATLFFVAAYVCLLGLVVPASGGLVQFLLQDHPDGNENPPPYGIRLDNLFTTDPLIGSVTGGVGGVTSFSFNVTNNVFLTVNDTGPATTINIAGTVFGGVDAGTSYGFGEGFYDLNFTFTQNVFVIPDPNGDGYEVIGKSILNAGTITAQPGITGVAPGTTWGLLDKAQPPETFVLARDGHRLDPDEIIAFGNPWVGRGWLMYSDGSGTTGGQDWLFLAIPEPSSLTLVACGIAGLMIRRRC